MNTTEVNEINLGLINSDLDLVAFKSYEACDVCGDDHKTEMCFQLGTVSIVEDRKVPARANLTLPANLRFKYSKEETSVQSPTITAKEKIIRGTRFGPVEARQVAQLTQKSHFVLKIINQDGSSVYLDTSCAETCNWMCMVLPADTLESQNLMAYQINNNIYFSATRDIRLHEELRVWYAQFYAKKLGITSTLPSTGEVSERPRKYQTRALKVSPNLYSTPPSTCELSTVETAKSAANPYQLRVRNQAKRRKKYEDFVDLNDEDDEDNEGVEKDEEEWRCSKCDETSRNKILFAKHLLGHYDAHNIPSYIECSLQGDNNQQHTCHLCQSRFSTVDILQQHYVDLHGGNLINEQNGSERLVATVTSISDADAATILLEIEAKCDKNDEQQQATTVQLLHSKENFIDASYEIGDILLSERGSSSGKPMDTAEESGTFSCDICKDEFTVKTELLAHLKNHAEEPKDEEYACVFCQKIFTNKRSLKVHVDRHTGTHTCMDCGKSYSTKETLKTHGCSSNTTNDNAVTCQICQKSFTKLKYLEKHIPVHTGNNACYICGKWLRSSDSLINHLRICGQSTKDLDEGGYAVCSLCKETFLNLKDFRQHMFQHRHAFQCVSCGARFRNKISLTNHVCSDVSNLDCDMCEAKYEDISALNEHRLNSHSQAAFKCNICKIIFDQKESLDTHECCPSIKNPKKCRPIQKQSLEPLVCTTCGSQFSSTSSLNIHRRLHGDKLFACEVCGKRFHRKDLMLDHWAVHGEPAIPCPICNKKFKTKKSLDVHLSIHDGVKRYSCEICGKQFYQKGNLLKHAEVHNPCRKYSCDRCPKSFSTKEYLAIHVLEHTKGKTFVCDICSKSFIKDHQLRAHQRIFHANVSYTCSFCDLNVKFKHSLKRHLRKKHMDKQESWRNSEVVNQMMVPCEMESNTKDKEESSKEEGEEVVLAVSGIGSEALQQALVSGAARIQQGSTPDTIVVTLPDEGDQNAILSVDATRDESNYAATHIIHLPAPDGPQNEEVDECMKEEEEAATEIQILALGEESERDHFEISLGSELEGGGTQITLDNEDQQILDAGGEIVLVNGAILRQQTLEDDNKVFLYVINSPENSGDTQSFEI